MKSKHDDDTQDQEVQELELEQVVQKLYRVAQKAPIMPTQDKTPFRNMEIPDDFPEMDVMTEAAEELDLDDAAEAAEAALQNECDKCEDHLKDNKRVIKRMKAVEKSKKLLQKLLKDQESQLKECREKLGETTINTVKLAETVKTNESAKEVSEQNNPDDNSKEEPNENILTSALFPCGQDITEGENCTFETNTQQELLSHYKHFHEVKCTKCSCMFNSVTELRNHEKTHRQGSQLLKCDFCEGFFPDRKSVSDHIKISHSHSKELKRMGCGHCDFETNVKNELTSHILKAHSEKESVSCNHCSYKTATNVKLEEHMNIKHSHKSIVCKFFLQNRCTRQGCTFRHENPENSSNKSDKQKCKRGPTCYFKSQGKCFYEHSVNEVHMVSKVNHNQNKSLGPHEGIPQSLWCKYQEACTKNSCPFRHFRDNLSKQPQRRGPMFL